MALAEDLHIGVHIQIDRTSMTSTNIHKRSVQSPDRTIEFKFFDIILRNCEADVGIVGTVSLSITSYRQEKFFKKK